MKIEFCCEEMRMDFFVYERAEVFEDGLHFYHAIPNKWEKIDTCPHCDAKIEITVRG